MELEKRILKVVDSTLYTWYSVYTTKYDWRFYIGHQRNKIKNGNKRDR